MKMDENKRKNGSKMDQNESIMHKNIYRNGWKWLKMDKKECKYLKNKWKWMKMDKKGMKNGWKWMKMDENGWKWMKI
jgi:hypothetical protein